MEDSFIGQTECQRKALDMGQEDRLQERPLSNKPPLEVDLIHSLIRVGPLGPKHLPLGPTRVNALYSST